MALRSWSDFLAYEALMQPGDVVEVDPLERAARSGRPVELALDQAPPPSQYERQRRRRQTLDLGSRGTRSCEGCARPAKIGVVQLRGGLCGRCRSDGTPDPSEGLAGAPAVT